MAHAGEVITRLSAAGIRLSADAGCIVATPRAALTNEHRELIRVNKPALLQLLTERLPPGEAPPLANGSHTAYRLWTITEPNGDAWTSSFAPPQTLAEILAAYGPGTVSVPVEDPDKGQPLPPDIEAAVLAWLDRIGEDCPDIRAQILDRTRDVPAARADYLSRARRATPQGPNHDPSATDPRENRA